ncbi:lipoprotein NlpI [Idiomarina tyrosinivorans]|uniref:Lipoprotein NlpI n=1 Tax=Idiomarina tyrosinivorans TaxID=1445662 RepID=A0A432ZRI2_9GAMM|nr:lipoprotein NlpI [Idiomarina tyrosinivorans]RUO80441.1 lipoprotein NlpI [Idiomarina tyrosinivorans]
MKYVLTCLSLLTLLSGCATLSSGSQTQQALVIAEPEQAPFNYQLELSKLSDILAQELTAEQKGLVYYRRGALYDAMGLRTLARIDFNRALEYRPRLADAYNFLGIQYTEMQEFQYAYEAFDSAIELNPEHQYAYLNRGLAEYYDQRIDLSHQDLLRHYKAQKQDPYRLIWLYLVEVEQDPKGAAKKLRQRQQQLAGDDWSNSLVELFLGDISEAKFLQGLTANLHEEETLTERLCEAYFYLGKYQQLRHNWRQAINYFKLALTTNVYEFVEHRFASVELQRSRAQLTAE